MNISNLKIGARLGAGFGLLIILLLIVAFIATTRIISINAMTDNILTDRYAKVALATQIRNQVNIQARFMRNAIIGAKDPEEVKSAMSKVEDATRQISDLMSKLESSINLPKGKELFRAMDDTRKEYIQGRSEAVKLLQEGKSEEAGMYLLKSLRPAQAKYLDAIEAMVQFQQEQMKKNGEQAAADGRSAIIFTLVLSAIATMAAIVIAWMISRSITRPMNEALIVANTVAAGDLTSRIEVKTTDETGQLLQALKNMNESLVKIVSEVRTGTDTIATASNQIAGGNLDLSSRTEQQASSLEETASSMEELTSTVKQNSDNARQANGLATTASEVARKGGTVVSQVVETMESINESSKKIVDIIGVIDGIAFQTNILALNAAVEAARAGEQGRGFAVVASEVRNLAQRSAAAAKEIKSLIDDSVEKVETGSKLVNQAGTTMEEIVLSIQRVTDIMGEISSATHEQTAGIEQINQAISEMDNVTQQNAALVEEASAAAQAMQDQASSLSHAVSVFKLNGMQVGSPLAKTNMTQHTRSTAATSPAKKATAPKLSTSPRLVANGVAGSDWEEF